MNVTDNRTYSRTGGQTQPVPQWVLQQECPQCVRCTIVATGKLENFTRDGINAKIISLGATPGSSVTKKTDYLICGEKAGSKLAKAQQLGIKVLTEQEFMDMIASWAWLSGKGFYLISAYRQCCLYVDKDKGGYDRWTFQVFPYWQNHQIFLPAAHCQKQIGKISPSMKMIQNHNKRKGCRHIPCHKKTVWNRQLFSSIRPLQGIYFI